MADERKHLKFEEMVKTNSFALRIATQVSPLLF
jgi:hypothetical protein